MLIDSLDFSKEFKSFRKSDINKTVWLDRYSCDTTYQNQKIEVINCDCSDERLKTQALEVYYKDGDVETVIIKNVMNKMLLETREYLTYKKDISYEVRRMQMLRTGGLDSSFVMVMF